MTSPAAGHPNPHFISGPLYRKREVSVSFVEIAPSAVVQIRRPARVARTLALAHHIQRAINKGLVADRADVARKLGLTRARITQLLDLLLLAPDIQAAVLALEAVDGAEPLSERALRDLTHTSVWAVQRVLWASVAQRGPVRRSRPVSGQPVNSPIATGPPYRKEQ